METITALHPENLGITDVTGVEALVNVTSLTLDGNPITSGLDLSTLVNFSSQPKVGGRL